MTMIMSWSPKKIGRPLGRPTVLETLACVLSVSAALGGQPIVKVPAEGGRSRRNAIPHYGFDAK
jgi:hypothetical protein